MFLQSAFKVFLIVCTTFLLSCCRHVVLLPPDEQPPEINLIYDIEPVRVIDETADRLLVELPYLCRVEQRATLNTVLRRLTAGIDALTMKDRILKYLYIEETDIKSISFYLVTGYGLEAYGRDQRSFIGYIKNGVVVAVKTKYDSLSWYILKCANGLVVPTHDKFETKVLIGMLEYRKLKDKIFFDFDQSEIDSLDAEERRKIKKWACFLKSHPTARMYIKGHADSEGTGKYNDKLSKYRARNIRDYMHCKLGVNMDQMPLTAWYGERHLIEKDYVNGVKVEKKAKRNRRVKLIVRFWEVC